MNLCKESIQPIYTDFSVLFAFQWHKGLVEHIQVRWSQDNNCPRQPIVDADYEAIHGFD